MFTLQIFQYLLLTSIGGTIGLSLGFCIKNLKISRTCLVLTFGSILYMVRFITHLMLATAT